MSKKKEVQKTEGKNIIVFSDGTGQGAGIRVDENRSNVYKLYRSMRVTPDTNNSPEKQVAFYDPGLGSLRGASHIKWKFFRSIYNFISSVTGFGITRNLIECYAFIIRVWEPGDRIYLFGFSRGAYTVRGLAGVLALCGIPQQLDGKSILKGKKNSVSIAKEAVVGVYQHGVGRKAKRYENQRLEIANNFREKYSSEGKKGESNVVPYFIGVWDTVAALGVLLPKIARILLVLVFVYLVWYFGSEKPDSVINNICLYFSYAYCAMGFCIGLMRFRFKFGLEASFWKTMHFRAWKMRFYNKVLNSRVQYAKHAISIDENRRAFDRVKWSDTEPKRNNDDAWFEQVWFAGVHSDIGGSYDENESRLSDIALLWMLERVTDKKYIKKPLDVDLHYLRLHPDPSGMQHDEKKAHRYYKLSDWYYKLRYKEGSFERTISGAAPLHASVLERFKEESVLHYDEEKPYRPKALKHHQGTKQFY